MECTREYLENNPQSNCAGQRLCRWQKTDFSDMISEVWDLKQKYGHVSNIYCDAANPEVVQALK
jgi:hypothetical protein